MTCGRTFYVLGSHQLPILISLLLQLTLYFLLLHLYHIPQILLSFPYQLLLAHLNARLQLLVMLLTSRRLPIATIYGLFDPSDKWIRGRNHLWLIANNRLFAKRTDNFGGEPLAKAPFVENVSTVTVQFRDEIVLGERLKAYDARVCASQRILEHVRVQASQCSSSLQDLLRWKLGLGLVLGLWQWLRL